MPKTETERFRFLLISDTHGELSSINVLAGEVKADAVIHAGDFGFYDESSYEALSERELRLQIIHSHLSEDERKRALLLSRIEQIEFAKQYRLLGDFSDYLSGEKVFQAPVYAVWGNHEDKTVVERLLTKEYQVKNLFLLQPSESFQIGSTHLYGLGGNFLASSKLLQPAIAGGGGKIWSTLAQYSELIRTVEAEKEHSGLKICVSHVSPGKEPFIEFMAARTKANLSISGHMGAPVTMVWNPFAVSSVEEAKERLLRGVALAKKQCLETISGDSSAVHREFSFIEELPEEQITLRRGVKVPRWYREMTHVNLPDAERGFAILVISGNRWKLDTSVRVGEGRD